jgi:CRP-like cAMP-binding protein
MASVQNAYRTKENRLLAALPEEMQERLRSIQEIVSLEFRESLYEPGQPIEYVYFLRHGVVSLITLMEDGASVEVGTVGNEGMVGLPVFLGTDTTSGQAFVQVPGEAIRMRAADFRTEINNGNPLRELINRYIQALFTSIFALLGRALSLHFLAEPLQAANKSNNVSG